MRPACAGLCANAHPRCTEPAAPSASASAGAACLADDVVPGDPSPTAEAPPSASAATGGLVVAFAETRWSASAATGGLAVASAETRWSAPFKLLHKLARSSSASISAHVRLRLADDVVPGDPSPTAEAPPSASAATGAGASCLTDEVVPGNPSPSAKAPPSASASTGGLVVASAETRWSAPALGAAASCNGAAGAYAFVAWVTALKAASKSSLRRRS